MLADGNFATHFAWAISAYPQGSYDNGRSLRYDCTFLCYLGVLTFVNVRWFARLQEALSPTFAVRTLGRSAISTPFPRILRGDIILTSRRLLNVLLLANFEP